MLCKCAAELVLGSTLPAASNEDDESIFGDEAPRAATVDVTPEEDVGVDEVEGKYNDEFTPP